MKSKALKVWRTGLRDEMEFPSFPTDPACTWSCAEDVLMEPTEDEFTSTAFFQLQKAVVCGTLTMKEL